ncbi:TIGR03087 family PEP-CTERM/XrtA system glycosyltransferase [Photobacterium minamisatsumaniensis]|uniref:TIGR03087 family PEP-CTERM/XrtA system glycosyltransferase n=1 Tax=Photobacterium minamisatsumaniensis TaxID=2910233 RepID=UPI003D10838E
MKEPLLYLCHRIPFPPNKGDKIASYNILKFLSKRYDIYLGCFIDDNFDIQFEDDVRAFCVDCKFITISRSYSKLKSLTALLDGSPITLPFYSRKSMQRWVDDTVETHQIQKAFVFSSCMAQYVHHYSSDLHTVMHFVDIDSDKWLQYAQKSQGVMKAIYHREHQTLAQYEKRIANAFSVSCFVTPAETEAFKSMIPSAIRQKIHPLENGLDSQFFSPDAKHKLAEPYDLANENYLVFTGAMDYWANADAVKWFTDHVWPEVTKVIPDAKFYIVGSSPTPEVNALADIDGITVTGRVEDVRPYLVHAKAAVAPMQIARGVQNKVLEAMAMAKPILVSSLGIEGIDNYPTSQLYVSDDASTSINWAIEKLSKQPSIAIDSRVWIKDTYSWDAKLSPLLNYLGEVHANQ